MENPIEQFNEYTDKIGNEVNILDERLKCLKSIIKPSEEDKDILKTYEYLFVSIYDLVFDSLIIQLCWFYDKDTSKTAKTSLRRWLGLLNAQSDSFFQCLADERLNREPNNFKDERSRESYKKLKEASVLSKDDKKIRKKQIVDNFKTEIGNCIQKINNAEDKIRRLEKARNKGIAHRANSVIKTLNNFGLS